MVSCVVLLILCTVTIELSIVRMMYCGDESDCLPKAREESPLSDSILILSGSCSPWIRQLSLELNRVVQSDKKNGRVSNVNEGPSPEYMFWKRVSSIGLTVCRGRTEESLWIIFPY